MAAVLSLSAPAFADDKKTSESPQLKPVSQAFLTYLAELVEVDGKLIHPTELEAQQISPVSNDVPAKAADKPTQEKEKSNE